MKQGWETKKMFEVCEELFAGGDVPKGNSSKIETDIFSIPIFSNGEKNKGLYGYTNVARVTKPSITISARGTIGYSEIRKEAFYPAIRLIVVIPNTDILELFFLKYVVSSIDFIHSGSSIPQLTVPMIKEYPVPIPPLPEQKRIVAILDKAFAAIAKAKANAEQNIKNAKELFQSIFNSFTMFKTEECELLTILDVVKQEKGAIRTGPFGSQLLHGEFVDEGIAVLGIDNAVANEFQWRKRRYITSEKFQKLRRFQVKPSDVIITIMGTCGRCAIIPENIPIAINTKHLCCITLDQNKCLPEYLHSYFLYHPVAQNYLKKKAKGAIMAGLNMGIIKEMPLLLPSIDEQKIIMQKITIAFENSRAYSDILMNKLENLEELKKAILQKAFNGEL